MFSFFIELLKFSWMKSSLLLKSTAATLGGRLVELESLRWLFSRRSVKKHWEILREGRYCCFYKFIRRNWLGKPQRSQYHHR